MRSMPACYHSVSMSNRREASALLISISAPSWKTGNHLAPPGADVQFFKDLEEFLTIAFSATNDGPFVLPVGGDTHELFRALVKATLYDRCKSCNKIDRINAILDFEQKR